MFVVYEYDVNAEFDPEWDIIRKAIRRENRRIGKGGGGIE
jgi:hypothetical protein